MIVPPTERLQKPKSFKNSRTCGSGEIKPLHKLYSQGCNSEAGNLRKVSSLNIVPANAEVIAIQYTPVFLSKFLAHKTIRIFRLARTAVWCWLIKVISFNHDRRCDGQVYLLIYRYTGEKFYMVIENWRDENVQWVTGLSVRKVWFQSALPQRIRKNWRKNYWVATGDDRKPTCGNVDK